ncbi:MAG: hypothetical protein WA958_06305 [Tunicatimonas sp.]
MMNKDFCDWKFEEVQRTFGLNRSFQHSLLEELLRANHPPSERDRVTLEELRQELLYTIDTLNEEELKVYFVGPLLRLIPFRSGDRRPFLDRPMAFTYGEDQQTSGRVDWMLASGIQDPRKPYFFIHEYKKEVEATGDPLGQLLIAMVGARHGHAQQQNEEILPLYGCYVLGRNWFFVVLKEHQYAVSIAFDATQEDIFRIYSVLEEIKIRTAV